jgi:2-aminoadipate transaminase
VRPADVVVTSGSQQALDLLARAVLDPGDTVVIEDPGYVGALQVFQAAGAALAPVGLDADGMRVDELADRLAAGLRPRLVHTVSSFHNPRGVTLAAERRRALADLAERYGFLVVEDDPYGLLAFDGTPPQPVAAHGPRVVRLGSASKVLAPALRVGWLVGPPEVTAAVELLRQGADLCGSTLTQAIAADLLADGPWFAGHLDTLRRAGAARAGAFTGAVAELLPGVRCSTPTGGMFCWLEFPDSAVDTAAALPRALEAGVGFVPGSAFAVEGALPTAARCCFASHPEGVLREAVRRLATVLVVPTGAGRPT